MSRIVEIKRNIKYMQGPQGQTVVIVPPKQKQPVEETNMCICYCCAFLTILLAFICLILGTVYGSIMLSIPSEKTEDIDIYPSMVKASIWLLSIAAVFVVITVCICRYMGHMKNTIRNRFMHRGSSAGQLIPTTNTEDDEGGFGMRSEIPTRTNNIPRDQRMFGSQQYGASPQDYRRNQSPFPVALHHGIPPERDNYNLHDSEERRVPGSDYRPQFHQPGRPFADAMHHEAASGFRSSPVTERSFSPASDTTYLSHHSTRS